MARKPITDRDHKILKLWNDGRTGTEIAEALGTTRSAILGRLHRLKGHGIDTAKRKPAGKSPQVAKKEPEKIAKPERRKHKTIKTYFPPRKLVIPDKYLTIPELTARSCRFIVNDGDHGVYLFCGQDKERGSYCGYHAKMCYIPTETKKTKRSKEFQFYKYGKSDAAY